jgi:phage terminase Nu1 subunit (DNA packaging protein)
MASPDQPRKTDRPLRRGVVKAVLSPVNLAVMAAASAGAVALGSVGVLAAGVAGYVALVAWDLSSQSFWNKVVGRAPARPPQLPALAQLFDADTKQVVGRIGRARGEIARVMNETPATVATHVEPVVASLAELDGRVARLALRADQIGRHLAAVSAGDLRREMESLAERAQRARDADTQREYQQARATRERQLASLADLAAARDRVLASLARILTTLEAIPTQIVKMGALDAQAVDDLSGDVGQQLGRINLELEAFEETLETLVEERPT